MSRAIDACVLCGSEAADRVMAIVEWLEPIGKEQWSHVPRCVDRPACRDRVERVLGEPWPVDDGTPAPEPLPEPSSTPAVVQAATPQEDPSWAR